MNKIRGVVYIKYVEFVSPNVCTLSRSSLTGLSLVSFHRVALIKVFIRGRVVIVYWHGYPNESRSGSQIILTGEGQTYS